MRRCRQVKRQLALLAFKPCAWPIPEADTRTTPMVSHAATCRSDRGLTALKRTGRGGRRRETCMYLVIVATSMPQRRGHVVDQRADPVCRRCSRSHQPIADGTKHSSRPASTVDLQRAVGTVHSRSRGHGCNPHPPAEASTTAGWRALAMALQRTRAASQFVERLPAEFLSVLSLVGSDYAGALAAVVIIAAVPGNHARAAVIGRPWLMPPIEHRGDSRTGA